MVLTGLPDAVVRESRTRLLLALEEHHLHVPQGRLHLNLHPAGLRKTGEALDLPMALAVAAACGHFDAEGLARALFLGELGIDGRLHAVPGGLAAAEAARKASLELLVAAPATAREAALLPGTRAFAADSLRDVVRFAASGTGLVAMEPPNGGGPTCERGPALLELDRVRGQALGKRALSVAAAGGHGLLFIGPPGTGKSLLARALVALLPPPSPLEQIEITRALSASGVLAAELARRRPFRAPHHTTSFAGLVGGGRGAEAGEITLAHRGVLFLDELAEFRREALEALRQPLESGLIALARASRRIELPARFQLVAAMNPCPCGFRGSTTQPCRCSPGEVFRYRRRVSGPLLDRIDLRLELPAPSVDDLVREVHADLRASALASRVDRARAHAADRQGERTNAELDADALDLHAPLEPAAKRLIERAVEQRHLSARAVQSQRRIARTLADLESSERVEARHLAEALALRAEVG